MLFNILQRNNFASFIIIPLVVLGLWIPYFMNPIMQLNYYDTTPMPMYRPLLAIYQSNIYIGMLLYFAAMSITILFLSRINSLFRLIEKRTSFYILLFVLMSAFFDEFYQFSPLPFAMCFVAYGLYTIFRLYKNERNLRFVFEAATSFSIASLLYINVIFFVIIVFVGIIILIPFNLRQWISALLGLFVPIVVTIAIGFLTNSLQELFVIVKENTIIWHETKPISFITYGVLGILALLLLFSFFVTFSGGTIKKVAIRKYYFILFFFIVLSIVLYFAIPSTGIEIFYFAAMPIAIFICNYLMSFKYSLMPELFATVLFLGIFFIRYI